MVASSEDPAVQAAENERIVSEIRDLLAQADQVRADCAESVDCGCSYKDCYECGKWHSCSHTPWTSIRAVLAGPRATTGAGDQP